ncbi:MAG TPA: hypothetical protein VI233_03580 [Puia sp.]
MKPRKSNAEFRFANVRYTAQEWEKLVALFDKTTCRSVSEYVRKVTLVKPIVQYFRNQSLDQLFDECIVFRNNMLAIRQLLPENHSAIPRLLELQQQIFELFEKIANHVTENQPL